jgi:hypothetical protein
MPFIALQFAENQCDKFIKFVSNDYKYIINIFYSSSITSEKDINNIMNHIYRILNWIIKIGNANVIKLKLDIILCPFKKTFTYKLSENEYAKYPWLSWTKHMKDDGIRPFNINTGLSYVDRHHIVIFRLDELFKVLLHECIHSLKYDFNDAKDCNKSDCETMLNKDVKLKIGLINSYPVLSNEAYTEYMAILCWNYYLASYYVRTSPNIINNKFELFYNMVSKELVNSAIMCNKLFVYYNITDLSILNKQNYIEQHTNAFSYILIKYILLFGMVNILDHKSANEVNDVLKRAFNNIHDYDYLLNICNDEHRILQLSLFHLEIS